MVNISIDVTDLGGEARPGDKVVLWRPRMGGSATHAGRVISTAPVDVFLTDGKATVSDVEPGEMAILLQCRGVESQGPVTVGVPDGDHTVTLRALLESQFEYAPPIVSAVQEAASNASASEEAAIQAQIRSEAAADRAEDRVDEAINNGANLVRNEVKQDADRAVSARQAATQSESNAAASEAAAASSESNAAASETNAKQSEDNAGDYAAVATTAATEAVDAMESASEAVSSIGDSVSEAAGHATRASQSESGAAAYAQNASDAADRVGTAEQVGVWAQQAQSAADSVTGQVQLVEDAVGTVTEKSQQVESAASRVAEWAAPKEWSTSYEQVIQPESYGALGNNSADDSDALQLALDASAASGLPVVLRNKTYRTSKTLKISSGAKLYGNQASTIRPNYGVDAVFEIKGTSSEQVAITSAANMGEYSIKIGDTSAFSAGDLIRLVSQRVAVSDDAGDGWRLGASTSENLPVYFGEFLRVAEVASATELVSESPIVFPGYLPNADAETDSRARASSTVEKVTPVKGVHLRGFKVTGYAGVVVRVELGDRVLIEDVVWESLRAVGSCIQFQGSIDCVARNCRAVYPGLADSGYASRNPFMVISSQNCGFTGCSAVRPTQGFDITFNSAYQTPSLYSFVAGCDTQSAIYHGATSHGGTIFSTFQGNRFLNCRSSGLNNRSRSSLIQGNTVTSSAVDSLYGIDLRQSGCVDTDVSGNVVNGFAVGVVITDTTGGLDVPTSWVGARIRGNTIRNFSRDGVAMNRQGNTYRGKTGINIEGNQIRGGRTTQSSCVRVDSYANGVSVRNNHLDGMGTCEALVVAEPNVDHLTVEGNTLRRCANYGVLMKARSDSSIPHPTLYIGMGNEIESVTKRAYQAGSDAFPGTLKWAKEPFQAYARVTGSVSDGTALSSLIAELTKIGIIQDRTT